MELGSPGQLSGAMVGSSAALRAEEHYLPQIPLWGDARGPVLRAFSLVTRLKWRAIPFNSTWVISDEQESR